MTLHAFTLSAALLSVLGATGCAVSSQEPIDPKPSDESATAENAKHPELVDKSLRHRCPPGEHIEWSHEGPGGKLIWYCAPD